ncbi:hypothetical protein ACH5RR_012818 [Cinchona calisaya]|uniref:Smr domain-containing protein n=1 Tax=Cinchona calisaya TaxID=153742 RepID=A0ABD3A8X8_9GENT
MVSRGSAAISSTFGANTGSSANLLVHLNKWGALPYGLAEREGVGGRGGLVPCAEGCKMTTSANASPQHMKMSCRRGRTSGWTAFDLEQRGKQGVEPEPKNESFPSISSSIGQIQNVSKNTPNKIAWKKPFASVLQNSVNFLTSENCNDMGEKKMQVGSSRMSEYVNNNINGVIEPVNAYDILKELHPWADQSLIEDVLAGVINDVDKASTLLKLMVSSGQNYKESELTETKESNADCKEPLVDENDRATDLTELSCLDGLMTRNEELTDEHASSGKMLLCDDSHIKMILNSVKHLPVEPEWEEDDIYLVQRKEARRMMRSASRQSKAANDAYLKGDHLAAQLYSHKAREEWMFAERLNAKAAKEILSFRNSKNDEWTLDLHGLHAAEAVFALQEHLQKIEFQMAMKHFACPSKIYATSDIVLSAAPEFAACSNEGSQIALYRRRPTSLQVITGKGNHSHGEAALPAAIRRFLIENGYHYNEARPGVIEVQPKFRRS